MGGRGVGRWGGVEVSISRICWDGEGKYYVGGWVVGWVARIPSVELRLQHFHFVIFVYKILMPYSRLPGIDQTDLDHFRHASFSSVRFSSFDFRKLQAATVVMYFLVLNIINTKTF